METPRVRARVRPRRPRRAARAAGPAPRRWARAPPGGTSTVRVPRRSVIISGTVPGKKGDKQLPEPQGECGYSVRRATPLPPTPRATVEARAAAPAGLRLHGLRLRRRRLAGPRVPTLCYPVARDPSPSSHSAGAERAAAAG